MGKHHNALKQSMNRIFKHDAIVHVLLPDVSTNNILKVQRNKA